MPFCPHSVSLTILFRRHSSLASSLEPDTSPPSSSVCRNYSLGCPPSPLSHLYTGDAHPPSLTCLPARACKQSHKNGQKKHSQPGSVIFLCLRENCHLRRAAVLSNYCTHPPPHAFPEKAIYYFSQGDFQSTSSSSRVTPSVIFPGLESWGGGVTEKYFFDFFIMREKGGGES